MAPRDYEALAPLLAFASVLTLDACSTDGLAGLGAAGSLRFPAGHHPVPIAAGRPRWADGCEEMRFGNHTGALLPWHFVLSVPCGGVWVGHGRGIGMSVFCS